MKRPVNESIRRFATGLASPEEQVEVSQWIERDPAAVGTVEEMGDDDTLVQEIKSLATQPPMVSPDVGSVIRRAQLDHPLNETQAAQPGATMPLRLDHFRTLGVLGRGGMGMVCEALDERLQRRVAMKIMRAELTSSPEHRKRFLREAQAVAAIEHDAIVPILTAGEADGIIYMVMPLLRGETLAERLLRGSLSLPMLMRIATDISAGLAAAHAAGFIHRDVKPSNIWLERNPDGSLRRARLLDFGLAQSVTTDNRLTRAHQILGTPGYMSPEQVRGDTVDARTDLFSLGCVMYECATGQRPFEGKSILDVLSKLVNSKPKPIEATRQDLPPALTKLIASMLAVDANQRPQSAQQVGKELDRIDGSLPAPLVVPESRSARPMVIALGSLGPILGVVLFGFLIKIQSPDGQTTTIQTGSDAKVVINAVPNSVITIEQASPEQASVDSPPQTTKAIHPPQSSELDCLRKLQEIGATVVIRTLSGSVIASTTAEQFEPGSQIIEIHAEGNARLTDAIFQQHIAPLQQLEVLRVPHTSNLTNAVNFFEAVSGMQKLRALASTLPLDDASCHLLSRCSRLTHVQWLEPHFTVAGARALAQLKSLVSLGFARGTSNDEAIAPLVELPWLESFSCPGLPVTGEFLAGDQPRPLLKSCDLSGTKINDDSLRLLQRFPNLESIIMEGVEVNGSGLGHLQELKQLKTLNLHGSKVSDIEGLVAVATLPNLEVLNLHATGIDDQAIDAIVAAGPSHLMSLDIALTQVTDRAAAAIVNLPALESLTMFAVRVSGGGFAKLAQSESLELLFIGSSDLDDVTITTLARREKPWREIWIHQSRLTDASVAELSKMTGLVSLKIFQSQISQEGFARLREALPKTELVHH